MRRRRRNPDARIRELERRAKSGDKEAARDLAAALLRARSLTVHDLAELGEPAARALPDRMANRIMVLLLERAGEMIPRHLLDPPPGYEWVLLERSDEYLREHGTPWAWLGPTASALGEINYMGLKELKNEFDTYDEYCHAEGDDWIGVGQAIDYEKVYSYDPETGARVQFWFLVPEDPEVPNWVSEEYEENPPPDERIRILERRLARGDEEAWGPLAVELLRVDRNLLLEDVQNEMDRRAYGRPVSDPRIERIVVSSPEYRMGLAPPGSWHVYFYWSAMERRGMPSAQETRWSMDSGNRPEWHVYADWRLMEALALDAARRLRYQFSFSGLSDEGAERLSMVGTEGERRALVREEPGRMLYMVDRPAERRR